MVQLCLELEEIESSASREPVLRQPLPEVVQSDASPPSLDHENIRGADYYSN